MYTWKLRTNQVTLERLKCIEIFVNFFTECANLDITELPQLQDLIQCKLSERCTAIECCLDVSFIQRSIVAYIDIDACYYKLTVGVDNLIVNISLIDYEWGSINTFSLNGVFNIK